MELVATSVFTHNRFGSVNKGDPIICGDTEAKEFIAKGLAQPQINFVGDKSRPLEGHWPNVICLASGPSLTKDIVEKVRLWREEDTETRAVYVSNTTYQLAPWADVLFAMDRKWWAQYIDDILSNFAGERVSSSSNIPHVKTVKFDTFGNSGAGCISLARRRGAKTIRLFGYDCHAKGGKHWHGNHPKPLGNAGSMSKWPKHFQRLADTIKKEHVEIINCTPGTALNCFKKGKL